MDKKELIMDLMDLTTLDLIKLNNFLRSNNNLLTKEEKQFIKNFIKLYYRNNL